MTDNKALITAFIASGLELREWAADVYFSRIILCDGKLWREWRHGSCDPWQHDVDADDRDLANEILRQLQERCDEALIDVLGLDDHYEVTRGGGDEFAMLTVTGKWAVLTHPSAPHEEDDAQFATRWEAMIAACVAVDKEQHHE